MSVASMVNALPASLKDEPIGLTLGSSARCLNPRSSRMSARTALYSFSSAEEKLIGLCISLSLTRRNCLLEFVQGLFRSLFFREYLLTSSREVLKHRIKRRILQRMELRLGELVDKPGCHRVLSRHDFAHRFGGWEHAFLGQELFVVFLLVEEIKKFADDLRVFCRVEHHQEVFYP